MAFLFWRVEMTTSTAHLPTLGETSTEGVWYNDAWTNPTYIYADDSTGASVVATSFDAGDRTQVLKATGFGFTVPSGAFIYGVTSAINAWSPTTDKASLDLVQLLSSTKGRTGTNKGSTGTVLSTDTDAVYTNGGATDLWECDLTWSWVNSTNFGIAMGAFAGGGGNNNVDVFIDSVTLTIDYSTQSCAPSVTLRRGGIADRFQTSSIQVSDMSGNLNSIKNREE